MYSVTNCIRWRHARSSKGAALSPPEASADPIATSLSSSERPSEQPISSRANSHIPTSEGKPKQQSIVQIDKHKILGYGDKGTVIYEGMFKKKEVAVKRILQANETLAKKEIEVLVQIEHPNVIKYIYFEEIKNYINIVLEKCCCSLSEFI